MTDITKIPAVQQIVAENQALSAALSLVEGLGSDSLDVRKGVRSALPGYIISDSQSRVVRLAMKLIAGVKIERGDTRISSKALKGDFEIVAKAWIAWAVALPQKPQSWLGELGQVKEGAIRSMTLQPWAQAVEALWENDPVEARRFFRRATEISAQLGTETNPAIQWTYAASFFGQET